MRFKNCSESRAATKGLPRFLRRRRGPITNLGKVEFQAIPRYPENEEAACA